MSPVILFPILAALLAQQPTPTVTLDFDYFKTRVQPILTAKREGHARCVSCHSAGTTMRLEPLPAGAATWNEEQSRKNFDVVRLKVVPGSPDASRLLLHPLAVEAGGDPVHDGGRHWSSKNDPEWQTLAAWVRGQKAGNPAASGSGKVRIIQTNAAGDNVHIIDPVTNRVVGEIKGIEAGHGAATSPDGRIYISNEADHTLDVVDGRTLRVTSKIPLSGRPNNIAASRDGRRVYVSIRQEPGVVDVIDTAALQKAKSIPISGAVHNTYVTPDGKFVVAGSIAGRTLTVIDAQTEQTAWVLNFDLGVRPIAFEPNPDGSTKRMFVQLSDLNGFAIVDFNTRKETSRVKLPDLPPGKAPFEGGGNASHGIAVTADGKTLVVCSRLNSSVYIYSLPDVKLLGSIEAGKAPDWVTLTPDSRSAYVANAQSNNVSVIDIRALKEVTRIPVGQVPKRNITALLP
jgi:YVTN family beta-propeller protein